jgi:hypothetical protein
VLLLLAGCAHDVAVAVKPDLPVLPKGAKDPCKQPVAHVGDDLGVLGLRWKATAICYRGKWEAVVVYSDDLANGLGGK